MENAEYNRFFYTVRADQDKFIKMAEEALYGALWKAKMESIFEGYALNSAPAYYL